MTGPVRVLIFAEQASMRAAGESGLAVHYYRVLRKRGVPVWLVCHARSQDELRALFPDAGDTLRFVADSVWQVILYRLGLLLPARLAVFTTGFLSRLITQVRALPLLRALIAEAAIDVVHQPMPVSPREPSLLRGLGVPVVIGPMNGGMAYPAAFARGSWGAVERLIRAGEGVADRLNAWWPAKREAAVLLVANARTRAALPSGVRGEIIEFPENGVDLALWQPAPCPPVVLFGRRGEAHRTFRFAFIGRLVDWKGVDLLLQAFMLARGRTLQPLSLSVVGDGPELRHLRAQSMRLEMLSTVPGAAGKVCFHGYLPQAECAAVLRQCNALVLPSLLECGGAVVLEAMAMGLPVIATRWGGPVDYLDETCGILVKPEGRHKLVSGFAEAIVRLANNPEEARTLGQAGRARIEKSYDWDRKVDAMTHFYQSVITEANRFSWHGEAR